METEMTSRRSTVDHDVVECSGCTVSKLKVRVVGNLETAQCVFLNVPDLGCGSEDLDFFLQHPSMHMISSKSAWLQVFPPGQFDDDDSLPPNYNFPSFDDLAIALGAVLNHYKVNGVVCLGEGAGGNILARFASKFPNKCVGLMLLHVIGSPSGFVESLKQKFISAQLSIIGMNFSVENYLMMHRFGKLKKADGSDEVKRILDDFHDHVYKHLNPVNLKMYLQAYMNRNDLDQYFANIDCNLMFLYGSEASQVDASKMLFAMALLKAKDRRKLEQLELDGCANCMTEAPEKVAKCILCFIQGLGMMGSLPMINLGSSGIRLRRNSSMEEEDRPSGLFRDRKTSQASTMSTASGSRVKNIVEE